jgi:hypothetical protein
LLNRAKERDYVTANALDVIAADCGAAEKEWAKTIIAGTLGHLSTWENVLS